jgi:hypothetical protein
MKFMGPTLSDTANLPQFVAYFFDPKNHQAGIPVDIVSYHFCTFSESDETPEIMQYTTYARLTGYCRRRLHRSHSQAFLT